MDHNQGGAMKRPSIKPGPKFITASDLWAVADRLELQATNRMMRNEEGARHDLRVAAKAIRELLRERAPGDQIISDDEP